MDSGQLENAGLLVGWIVPVAALGLWGHQEVARGLREKGSRAASGLIVITLGPCFLSRLSNHHLCG